MNKQEFQQRYDTYRREIEAYLKGLFADHTAWGDLYESMRYSLLAGGKRIRPAAGPGVRPSGWDGRLAGRPCRRPAPWSWSTPTP